MLRREVSPLTVGIAVVAILVAVQLYYWRALVFREPQRPPGGGGGGGPMASERVLMGRIDVLVETLAGGEPGFRDGEGWQARFSGPAGICADPQGNLLVADSRNHRIRRITPAGVTSTLAGGGDPGGEGDRAEGAAQDARFRYPTGVACAPDGTIYIADAGNFRLCRLRDGRVEAWCGGSEGTADGAGAAARFRAPGLMLAEAGVLWVADAGRIRRVDTAGKVATVATAPGHVLRALGMGPGSRPLTYSPDGQDAPVAADLTSGRPGAALAVGNAPLLVPDSLYNLVLGEVQGAPFLLAGRRMPSPQPMTYGDGEGTRAGFALPAAILSLPGGNAYLTEYEGNRIRRLRLPAWLQAQEPPPPLRRRPGWRRNRGS